MSKLDLIYTNFYTVIRLIILCGFLTLMLV